MDAVDFAARCVALKAAAQLVSSQQGMMNSDSVLIVASQFLPWLLDEPCDSSGKAHEAVREAA